MAVSGYFFFAFVADVRPQRIELTAFDLEVGHQYFFHLLGMVGRLPQPSENRVFFEAFRPRETADATPFGQQR